MEKSDHLKDPLDKYRYAWNLGLSELEELIKSPDRDKLLESYPILHVLLYAIYYKEKDRKTLECWLEELLKADDVDVHSEDKDGNRPLVLAGTLHQKNTVEILLKCPRVDANHENKNNKTALEEVLPYCNIEILQLLQRATNITKSLQKRLEEYFLYTFWAMEISISNILIELNLIQIDNLPKPPIKHHRGNKIDEPFVSGLWIRTLPEDYNIENSILNDRQNLSDEDLDKMGHQDSSQPFPPNYTNYSPATFVAKGIGIPLYCSERPGVIIRTKNRILSYFYYGVQERLTREGDGDLDYSKETLNNGAKKDLLNNISEKELLKIVEKQHLDRFEGLDDKFKIFSQKEYQIAPLPQWNEGLFRYKRSDVIGIYVPYNPYCKNKLGENIKAASNLKTCLNLPEDTPMFCYYEGEMWDVKDLEK